MTEMKRKNRKGFSLVELIVVLVIMAILIAALVPSLIGYIKQARERNAIDMAQHCVQAAQTVVSAAYADPGGNYTSKSSGRSFAFSSGGSFGLPSNTADLYKEIEELGEVDGEATVTSVTLTANYKIHTLDMTTARNQVKVHYEDGEYKEVP